MTTSIGKCRFEGSKPSRGLNSGGLQIYHNGSVRKTGIRGGKNVWSGSGDVWVIYNNRRDVGNQIFEISGKVQECFEIV